MGLANWLSFVAATSAGEWALLVTALLGTSGLSVFVTGIVAFRKIRQEAAAQRDETMVRTRTVAAEEAETAVRIIASVAGELRAEVAVLHVKVEQCEARYREHAKVCPLLGGRSDGARGDAGVARD